MIIVPDVEDDILGSIFLFNLKHAAKGLVDAVTTNTIITDWLSYMCRQVLLPGFTVADLVAVCEAVTISMNAAGLIAKIDDLAGAIGFVAVETLGAVYTAWPGRITENPPQVGIECPALIETEFLQTLPTVDEIMDLLAAGHKGPQVFSDTSGIYVAAEPIGLGRYAKCHRCSGSSGSF